LPQRWLYANLQMAPAPDIKRGAVKGAAEGAVGQEGDRQRLEAPGAQRPLQARLARIHEQLDEAVEL
jgi:hypothetical protein